MAFRSMPATSGYTIHTAEATLDPGNVGAGGPHVAISLGSTTGGGGLAPQKPAWSLAHGLFAWLRWGSSGLHSRAAKTKPRYGTERKEGLLVTVPRAGLSREPQKPLHCPLQIYYGFL